MKNVHRLLVLCLLSLPALPASAHHSRSAFDLTATVEVRGEVVEYRYRSPHAYLVVDGIAYVDGQRVSADVERWEWESESVPVLVSRGQNGDTYQPGDAVTLRGRPSRREGHHFALLGETVSLNGQPLTAQDSERTTNTRRAAAEGGVAPDAGLTGVDLIAGRWVPVFRPPGNGSVLPLTEAGLQAWQQYDPKLSPANTCESMGVPEIFHAPFYLYDISLTDTAAILTTEAYEIRRTVPLDGSQVAADDTGAHGLVKGRIEGDALVIESTGFPASRWGLGAATQINGGGADVPSSDQKTLTERYTTSPDGRTLYYDYTLNDPVYLTQPYSFRISFQRLPASTPMYPYECDVESASAFSRGPEDQ
jgi:hypothetical protein